MTMDRQLEHDERSKASRSEQCINCAHRFGTTTCAGIEALQMTDRRFSERCRIITRHQRFRRWQLKDNIGQREEGKDWRCREAVLSVPNTSRRDDHPNQRNYIACS